ncbi:MAG: hypothetical protein JXO44_04545 [Clostridia bacterium]|nr:hypothetical protein [Clostridia bacterium]
MDRKTSLLDWVDQYPETEEIIREYDEIIGVCILCTCLFDSIEVIENNYNVDLTEMLERLQEVARG